METTSLAPDEIVVGDRMRQLDPDAVERLKTSIASIGVKTPLSVRFLSNEEGWLLITGRHRLQACIELGIERVPVRQEFGSEQDARMWEIAENLHRADLTVTERAHHIAEWVRLAEEREKLAGASCATQIDSRGQRKSAQQRPSGINSATRELGLDRTEAQRAVKIDALPPEVKAEAKVLHLDNNQSAMLKAARQPSKEEQLRALREHAASRTEPRVVARPPARDPLNDTETVERQVDSLMSAWNRAGPEARAIFLDRIDLPVADNTVALRVV